MRKLNEMMKSLHFRFNEVDVELNGWEMFHTLVLGAVICSAPFIIKALLTILF